MQAILTKYIPETNTKPSRIKASCDRGSLTISYPHDQPNTEAAHVHAANVLCLKFAQEDQERHGEIFGPWTKQKAFGGLPKNGGYVHVFVD